MSFARKLIFAKEQHLTSQESNEEWERNSTDNYNFECDNQLYIFITVKYTSVRVKVTWILSHCSQLLTVRHLWQVVGLKQVKERSWQKRSPAITWILGSQHSDWTKLFQLVFQCNSFLMNLLSYIKQRKEEKSKWVISWVHP